MAHGTKISGANKAVTAGFTRISGVNKKVKKGLTQVGGVQKNIEFGTGMVSVDITGTPNATYGYVKISGANITATGRYEYDAPIAITVYVTSGSPAASTLPVITFNGTEVARGNSSDYTFETSSKVVTINFSQLKSGKTNYCTADITEE